MDEPLFSNFDEKTVKGISCLAVRKFSDISENDVQFVTWDVNTGEIVCGGSAGDLRILKVVLDPLNPKGSAQSCVFANMPLVGHLSTVIKGVFNEKEQKLITSDTNGLTIIWNRFEATWVEENINKREGSLIVGLSWNAVGSKLAMAFEDGTVTVGTLDGRREWNREFKLQLTACEWSPIDDKLLLGTKNGNVLVYNSDGSRYKKVAKPCLENEELESASARKNQLNDIVVISYWSPHVTSSVPEEQRAQKEAEEKGRQTKVTDVFFVKPAISTQQKERLENAEPVLPIPSDRPRLMVAYASGAMQLMRFIEDQDPVVIQLEKITIVDAKWSPNGAVIGVCGTDPNNPDNPIAFVHFLSAYGHKLGYFEFHEGPFRSLTWDSTGYFLAFACKNAVIMTYVRPEYKWGRIEDTLVYVFPNEKPCSYTVMFYDYRTEKKREKDVKLFENMACCKDHCVIVHRQEDIGMGMFYLELCNTIGNVLDYNITTVYPKFVDINKTAAVIANESSYYIWHFELLKVGSFQGAHATVAGVTGEYLLEEQEKAVQDGNKKAISNIKCQIVSLCMGDTFFLIGLQDGGMYRVNLSDGVITTTYPFTSTICEMKFNCNFTRLAVVKSKNSIPFVLHVYEVMSHGELLMSKAFEKTKVWDLQWDQEDPNMLVFRQEFEFHVLNELYSQPSISTTGYIFSFKNLVITSVHLDEIMLSPENPPKDAFQEIMIGSKKNIAICLKRFKFDEAIEIAEKSSNVEFWTMIADAALLDHRYNTAEHAFVEMKDYAGVQFIKKLLSIPSINIRKAEILAYMDKFEEAEDLFLKCNRKDLAVEMYQKVDMHLEVYNLIKDDDDEEAKNETIREMADENYYDNEYEKAAEHYELCGDVRMQVECLIKAKIYGKLEEMMRTLNDFKLLEAIGDFFKSYGMCEQSVDSYLKCDLPQKAVVTCIELTEWHMARSIVDAYRLEDVHGLLGEYSMETKGASDEKSMNTLEIFMRAGRHLDAAKMAFDIANDRKKKNKPFDDLKQCYVLVGILVEDHRNRLQRSKKVDDHHHHQNVLTDESGLTADQIRILENAWKGAEAFHFMMLAHQHLFHSRIEDSLQTSLILADYDEFLDIAEVYKMIALAAANCGQFKICSKFMMKLEAYERFSDVEREEMKNLSFALFSKNPPFNPRDSTIGCPSCNGEMNRFDLECPKCYLKFPICVATGRTIHENTFWTCRRCKHHANQREIQNWKFCPLCHDEETFEL